MAQPDLILTPFGTNAPPGNIDVIPETLAPSDPPQKASWQGGFPPVTMIPLAAGGIPPRGQDFNGVLKAISEHTVYQGGGGQYKWDAGYVAANGGYEKGAVIQSDDGTSAYVSLVNGNTDNFNSEPSVIGVTWAAYAGGEALDSKAEKTTRVIAGAGLSGGGDLSQDRTLTVKYGTTADTAAEGNDPRFSSSVTNISSSATLDKTQLGLVLVDASAGPITITLPTSDLSLGVLNVVIRRIDNSGNRLVVQAAGTDRIKFHTHLRAEGYPFLVLMGAGDYWHLRSDGAGGWWPVARRDDRPLGSYLDTAGAIIPPGGYGLPAGTVQVADYPWLLDYANASDALVAVGAREAKDGRWSISTDEQTIYLPSPGSAFRRPHDPVGTREMGSYVGDQMRNITASWANDVGTRDGFGATGAGNISDFGSFGFAMQVGSTYSSTASRSFDASLVVPTGPEFKPEDFTACQLLKII